MFLEFDFESYSLLRIFYILKILKSTIFTILPVILLIVIIISIIKAVINEPNIDVKKLFLTNLNKLIICCLIFFVPFIINIFGNLIDKDFMNNYNICMSNATPDNINYYKLLEDVQRDYKKLSTNPNQNNINDLKNSINKLKGNTRGTNDDNLIEYYNNVINTISKDINNENENEKECKSKNGIYSGGNCVVPISPEEISSGGNSSSNKNLNSAFHFKQGNYKGSNSFCEGGTIASRGCSTTATAICVSLMTNTSHDPLEINKTLKSNSKCTGSRQNYSVYAAKIYGLNGYLINKSETNKITQMISMLEAGSCKVVARIKANDSGRYKTSAGHYIALVDAKVVNGVIRVLVWDPSSSSSSRDNYWADFNKDILGYVRDSGSFGIITK